MPIRPELRKFYGREWREVTRPRILRRAGDNCEQCGVPNNTEVMRAIAGTWRDDRVTWRDGIHRQWRDCRGAALKLQPPGPTRIVRIVLTVAHLNHVSGDDRDENLKALCQWCHLNYDQDHHRETRSARKDAARPLLQEAIA